MAAIESTAKQTERNWAWMLTYGILLILAGIFAALNPLATGLAVGLILAISFLVGGAASLIAAFKDAGWQSKTIDIVFGVLAIIAGALCIISPVGSAMSVVWIVGILFMVSGIFEIIAGLRADKDKLWLILLGICDIVIGFWVAFPMGPGAALAVLAIFVGVGFVIRGVTLSIMALQLRRLAKI